MRASPADHRLPLPRGWPERIRSAVIYTISLAHFALTFTRSVAANSINARIRLKAENNRLQQEVALLMEEARIIECIQRLGGMLRFYHRAAA